MRRTHAILGASVAMLLLSSISFAQSSSTFLTRLYALRTRYPGRVHIAKQQISSTLTRPAIFIDTKFGQGDYYGWTAAEQAKFAAFRKDLLKALGTNTLQLFNPADQNYLHIATGTGTTARLCAANKGRMIHLYSNFHDEDFDLPTPDTERTCVMVKLDNTQLGKLDGYLSAIRDDFEGTLGPPEYDGGVPPYVSGDPNGSHNCTSWITSWLEKEVRGGLDYGAHPPSWCQSTARGYASPVRGILVFNHPNAPRTGQTISRSFNLNWGFGND